MHLCRRAGARVRGEAQFQGGYEPIIDQLNRLKVHHLTMEFTTPGAGDMTVFKKLREDFEIGLGCVSVEPGQIDSAETIAARVRLATQYLAPERIVLNPDCGFAPGSGASSASTKPTASCATRWRRRRCCARNFPDALV